MTPSQRFFTPLHGNVHARLPSDEVAILVHEAEEDACVVRLIFLSAFSVPEDDRIGVAQEHVPPVFRYAVLCLVDPELLPGSTVHVKGAEIGVAADSRIVRD